MCSTATIGHRWQAGALKQLQRIIARIRQVWPKVKIRVRGDSGFCREPTMAWCEANDVDYVFGLAQNPRLLRLIAEPLEQARRQFEATKQPTRVFADLRYKTLDSWSRERRVVAKAEHLEKGANPRFVVTSFGLEEHPAKELYEETYCSRGEMENRIKEQQLHLFADRTSAETMRANQIRLFCSSIAYTLLETLRRLGSDGDLDGPGTMPDDPAKTVEDRCLGASDCAESLGAIGQQLPLR